MSAPINDAAPGATEAGSSDQDAANHNPEFEISRHLRCLFRPCDIFEIRSPKCPDRPSGTFTGTISGYCTFERIDDMAREIAALDAEKRAPAIYVTINPVRPELLARAVHRLKPKVTTTTSDAEILCRRHFLIDLDPVRPMDTSSTDAELALAIDKAERVKAYRSGMGWPKPLVVMSGNGIHLVHEIDLPADDGGLIERLLKALAERFDEDGVKIDSGVGDAARITKIAGNLSHKGDDFAGLPGIEPRPHPKARIVSMLAESVIVSKEMLEAIAGEARLSPPPRNAAGSTGPVPVAVVKLPSPTGGYARFDHTPEGVRGYLQSHGLTVRGERRGDARTYLDLDRCPVVAECQSTGASDTSVIVGDNGKIGYKNQHNRGQGIAWLDVREALEPGYRAHADAKKKGTPVGPDARWRPPLRLCVKSHPPPFPLNDVFPASLAELREFMSALADEVQVPVDLVAMLVIAVAAACLAKKFEIEARAGWREICGLWVLVLLVSGERKSVILRRLTDVILEWEEDEAERLAP